MVKIVSGDTVVIGLTKDEIDSLDGGKPLIAKDFAPAYHMIDAEAFVDEDGTAYLYWGSGLNWTNGHCFVVKLNPDMVSFDGEFTNSGDSMTSRSAIVCRWWCVHLLPRF